VKATIFAFIFVIHTIQKYQNTPASVNCCSLHNNICGASFYCHGGILIFLWCMGAKIKVRRIILEKIKVVV